MEYSGEDNLDVMNLAHNHIQYITDEIINAGITEAKGKIVDFGAGNGLYAGKLQDILGTSIVCIEPADNMMPYLKGFQTRKNIGELTEKAGFIYSLDVF